MAKIRVVIEIDEPGVTEDYLPVALRNTQQQIDLGRPVDLDSPVHCLTVTKIVGTLVAVDVMGAPLHCIVPLEGS